MRKAQFTLLTATHSVTCHSADLESSPHLNSDAAICHYMCFTLTSMVYMVTLGYVGYRRVMTGYGV